MTAPPAGTLASRRGSDLEQKVDVETPEQVVLSYTVAGAGSRVAAALVDSLVSVSILIGLIIVLGSFTMHGLSGTWVVVVSIVMLFAINWGYYVIFEGLWDGQTPGKRLLGLRVVRDGGYSITFGASAVRNLLRAVDSQPAFMYGVGILSMLISKSGKRLGDYAAGTFVVRERPTTFVVPVVSRATVPSAGGEPVVRTARLDDQEFDLLERYIQRRQTLEPARRAAFVEQLSHRFFSRMPEFEGDDDDFLSALYESERLARVRGVAAASDTGAAREQYAIAAEGAPRWQAFASQLATARQRGLAGLPEERVSEFVAGYREITTDLARLTTATRGVGREVPALLYLNRLAAGGHNLLYRERPVAARSAWRYLTISVPREIRRSAGVILLAALLLYGPAVIAYVAVVRHPDVAGSFIPQGMLERAQDGVRRAQDGEGYIPDPGLFANIMATSIIANNISVVYTAFAGGVLAGVGTVVALVYNGIELGGVFGLYQSKGVLSLILAFVVPHGVLELTAICIAGGAGLLLGSAILLPGALTRREALAERGQRAIRLVAAATVLLIPAGLLEGFVSPQGWWTLSEKLTVSAVTAVMLALYINFDRGRN